MKNPIISIIVPVYNREKLLWRMANSIIPQLSEEVELILVDDGSTDSSLQICYEIAKQSSFIKVVHKKNGGVSSARNLGIRTANGEYLSFVDSDDKMELNSYAKILQVVRDFAPDMIDFGWKYISQNGEITENLHHIPKNVVLDELFIKDVVIPPLINVQGNKANHIYPFSCTKIFKKEIITKNNVYLSENRKVWEDQPFIVSYLRYAKSLYCLNDWFYCYMDTPGSLSRTYTTDFFRIIIENYHFYKTLFSENYDFETQYVYDYWRNAIVNMVFRSFEEEDVNGEITKVIRQTLCNDIVVNWFAKATNTIRIEKNLAIHIQNGNIDEALILFRKYYKRNIKIQNNKNKESIIKRIAKILKAEGHK